MNSGDCFAHNDILALVAKTLDSVIAWPAFIYGDSFEERLDGKGLLLKKAKSHSMCWYGMFTQHQSMFFAKKRMTEFGLHFDEQYSLAADWDFVVRFLGIIPAGNILRLDVPISIFAKRGASSNYTKAIAEQFTIRRGAMKWSLIPCVLLAALHQFLNILRILFPAVYYGYNHLRTLGYPSKKNGKTDNNSI